MSQQPLCSLPATIPVFPLASVLLLPGAQLPLNIFEPRYRAMVEHALIGDRLIGMVHPSLNLPATDDDSSAGLMPMGCAGTIESCERLPDGRLTLMLNGLSRFRVGEELPLHPGGFRQVEADWSAFTDDLSTTEDVDFTIDREALLDITEKLLPPDTRLNQSAVNTLNNADLVRALAMHTPLSVWDMQAVLDAPSGTPRAQALLAALECALAIRHSTQSSEQRH